MHGIYNCMPETKHVSRVYSLAGVLYLQIVLNVTLFRMLNIFCTFILVLSEIRVQCPI
jgi:hypothetical protein